MHSVTSLFTLGLIASASANFLDTDLLRREVDIIARATSLDPGAAACTTALKNLETLVTDLPKPTGELSSFLLTEATLLTNPCSLNLPSSIAPAFSAYESQVLSFYHAHEDVINSALGSCPTLTKLVSNPVCTTGAAVHAATTDATTVGTSVTTTAGTAPTTTGGTPVPTGAAVHATGMMAAALAGFLGVVAMVL